VSHASAILPAAVAKTPEISKGRQIAAFSTHLMPEHSGADPEYEEES